jgi:hypothetical protein
MVEAYTYAFDADVRIRPTPFRLAAVTVPRRDAALVAAVPASWIAENSALYRPKRVEERSDVPVMVEFMILRLFIVAALRIWI